MMPTTEQHWAAGPIENFLGVVNSKVVQQSGANIVRIQQAVNRVLGTRIGRSDDRTQWFLCRRKSASTSTTASDRV